MAQKSEVLKTSDIISGTNFDPMEWSAMESLRQDQGKQFGQDKFDRFLEDYDLTRKKFCSIFGIAESTLSGWLSGKGIPATTALAMELAQELDVCREQLRRMTIALDAAEYDMRVVEDGETYSIVQFPFAGNEGRELEREVRQPVGTIIARGIPAREIALSLTRSEPLLRMLRELRTEFEGEQRRSEYFGSNFRAEAFGMLDYQLGRLSEMDGSEE